jgi:peptidoglycan-associated lipoprotein
MWRGRLGMVLLIALLVALLVPLAGCQKKTPPPPETAPAAAPQPPAPTPIPAREEPKPTPVATPKPEETAKLGDVFYDYDKFNLSTAAREILTEDARILKQQPQIRVTIEGHCDERGTNEYNLALGQRRADAAKSFLVSLGIDAGRVTTITYGEERPFDPGHTEAAWAKNRRAHFVIH